MFDTHQVSPPSASGFGFAKFFDHLRVDVKQGLKGTARRRKGGGNLFAASLVVTQAAACAQPEQGQARAAGAVLTSEKESAESGPQVASARTFQSHALTPISNS